MTMTLMNRLLGLDFYKNLPLVFLNFYYEVFEVLMIFYNAGRQVMGTLRLRLTLQLM